MKMLPIAITSRCLVFIALIALIGACEGGVAVQSAELDEETIHEPGPCQQPPMLLFGESFCSGGNEGAWSLGDRSVIESGGGDPGAFLHEAYLDTFAPLAQTQWEGTSVFTGKYREQRVMALTASFKIFSVSRTVEERPMSLMLVSDPGTPLDYSDDTYVYYVGPDNIPLPGTDWSPYQFEVPSHSLTLPLPHSQIEGEPGWVVAKGDVFTPAKDPHAGWNTVMEDVDQVIFWFHDPRYFAIFQSWNVGMDNPSLWICPDAASPT